MGGSDKQTELAREADALFGGGRRKKERPRFEGVQGCAQLHVLDSWWRRASPGDEFIYCEALEPIRNDETWQRAGELARAGFLRTHERLRAGGGKQYFVVRTSKRVEKQLNPVEACLADPATDAILRALKRAANLGMPCPSDAELARAAGLNTRDQAQWRVRKLVDVGLISSTLAYEGGVPSRVVTIAASGKFTALPRKWAELQRAAERDARAAGGAR